MEFARPRVHAHIVLACWLLVALAADAAFAAEKTETFTDIQHGLTWLREPGSLLPPGSPEGLLLPRAQAFAILAELNAAPGQGPEAWRLPTPREVSRLVALAGPEHGAGSAQLDLARAWLGARLEGVGRSTVGSVADLVLLWPVKGHALAAGFTEVSVLGTNSVRLKNRAEVRSGHVVANDISPGPTLQDGWELALDPFASTAALSDTFGDSVWIKNNAAVGGDVSYNNLKLQGTVGGAQITPLSLPVFSLLPLFISEPPAPGSPDVTVGDGGITTLPPGDYGAVTVGVDATLILAGGVYNFGSLSVAASGEVLFAAAGEVRVEGRVATGKGVVVGPESGSGVPAHDLVFYVAGINGEDGALGSTPRAAEIGPANGIAASFYVPDGTLRLGQGTLATGAFLGRDVLVENRTVIELDSYFRNRAPLAVNDSATVAEGGSVSLLDSGAASVLANDSDPNGDTLVVSTTPLSGPSHGALVLASDGTFTYSHNGSETLADEFVYQVCDDGTPQLCATATVTITVEPVNDPPVANDDFATVASGGTVTILNSGASSLLANDNDPEGGSLALTTTPVSGPTTGTVTLNSDGTFSYTHDGGDSTRDSFVYEACDNGSPVECDTATVEINIGGGDTLTVVLFGSGTGQVTSLPAGINCGSTCSASFAPSPPVVLTAVADPGSVFAGFSGHADCADGVVTVDDNKTCFARFNLETAIATLTVTLAGEGGGVVLSSPGGITCPGACAATYPIPTRVELLAEPSSGSVFAGWTGDEDCEDGVINLFENTSCTANFDSLPPPPPSFTLTVLVLGSGSGSVTSNPVGIACDQRCSATFPPGATVTLFARPLDGNITSWGGDCSGTSFSTSVVMDANKTCTVTIDL